MLNKIDREINDFTNSIKTIKGYDELLIYMNSSVYSSIKLLLFASKTFTLYGRVLLFLIISLTGLLILSTTGVAVLNTWFLVVITVLLFISILAYIIRCKKHLILSIENSKNSMKENEEQTE